TRSETRWSAVPPRATLPGMTITWRSGEAADAAGIAALHADSWRRPYRGAYPDDSLDGPVDQDRLTVWSERLGAPTSQTATVLAEAAGELVGFVHVIFDADPEWGSLIDNLHVRHDLQRTGLGRELMRRAGGAAAADRPR